MTPQVASQLSQALASQAPPPNPATPDVRTDPEMVAVMDYHRVRLALERALENEQDPLLQKAFHAMHGAVMQKLMGADAQAVLAYLTQSLSGSAGPAQMPMPPGAPGAVPMGPGPAAGMPGMTAGPQGPPMPGMPPGGMGMPPMPTMPPAG